MIGSEHCGFPNLSHMAISNENILYGCCGFGIFRIAENGEHTLFAGKLSEGGFIDGIPSIARFKSPHGMAFCDDILYICDFGSDSIRSIEMKKNGMYERIVLHEC